MSDKSGIEWTEATWNPATGCTKVSPGCKNCYAKHQSWPRLAAMKTGVYSGRKFEDVQVHEERLDQPLRWRRPRMIFVNSMSDLFHEDIPTWFIDHVFAVMALANRHIFQVLTKRPARMMAYMSGAERGNRTSLFHRLNEAARAMRPSTMPADIAIVPTQKHGMVPNRWPFQNIWLGVSVENQETADERIPLLRETPAAVRWLSCEPLLDAIDLEPEGLDWIVVGGESGPKARPMEPAWAQRIKNRCFNRSVPFFMKQGSQANWPKYLDFDSFPRSLQVREYPDY